MKTKKGEKEKLRNEILDKSLEYLKKHGQGGSGTDHIMKSAGLTRGALYSHFKSKDDLFAQAVCHDLKRLEKSLENRFRLRGREALKEIIADHLSEDSLKNVEEGCVFTSLSTDMQRSKPMYRGMYEEIMNRIYSLFALMIQEQFPDNSREDCLEKALNLYSGLVGTLTMARTMKEPAKARQILSAGRKFLTENFTASLKPA